MDIRTIDTVTMLAAVLLLNAAPVFAETMPLEGGVVVRIGCGDPASLVSGRGSDSCIVHGLDTNAEAVAEARKYLKSKNLCGRIFVSRFAGTKLPYAENLVDTVMTTSPPSDELRAEIQRVLVPRGVLMCGKNEIYRKPVPEEIDEWTHWLHGPDGNAVADDRRVGPPRRMQWIAAPRWSRHHNLMPSVSAMVSATGRLFYIVDEAPAAMTGDAPDKWMLVARNAFSGVELWRLPIDDWGWRAWSWRWEGRFNQPNQVARRLVAADDRVYVTLGFNAPLTALDAATGKLLKTYEGTDFTDEILYQDGLLILSINHEAQRAANLPKNSKQPKDDPDILKKDPPIEKSVAVLDAATGKQLWKTGSFVGNSTKTAGLERITHLLLAARNDGVYFLDGDRVFALDLKTGKKRWEAPRPKSRRYTSRYYHLMSDMCTLVATDEAILLCQLEPVQKRIGWRVIKARTRAYAPETGKTLWTKPCGNWGHFCVPDVFVTGGLVWLHDSADMVMRGRDLITGEEKKRLSTETAFSNGHHHRCYRNKATSRYLMTSYRGFEFIDWQARTTDLNHWVRGACRHGGVPCNGLVYATPHPCDCYISGKLNGLIALAPAAAGPGTSAPPSDTARLVKGPAYAEIADLKRAVSPACWPTYRHDAGRSGGTVATVPGTLSLKWTATPGGRLSAPVAAGGRVIVGGHDTHSVHALDAKTGTVTWRYDAEGPVAVPPTLHGGCVLFGCMNGWIYCLLADNGELAWRFLAAPEARLVGAFGGLESAWPVHGGVLVQDNRLYAVAGRSSFLDGGMIAWCLDPATGGVLEKKRLAAAQSEKVDTGRNVTTDYGTVADVLVGDGGGVFMRHQRVFGTGAAASGWGKRLGATAGMLDDSWFNRTCWILDGTLHGETLVYDDRTAYAVRTYSNRGHGGFVKAGRAGYTLAAAVRNPGDTAEKKNGKKKRKGSFRPPQKDKWTRPVSLRVRALAVAGKTLLCVGTPDILDPDQPWAAYEGNRGGILLAVSAADGKTLSELTFEGGPVHDGIAVTENAVFITTIDGRVLRFGGE